MALCHAACGAEAFSQRRLRFVEDRYQLLRGAGHAPAAVLKHALWLAIAVTSPATARTGETVRPTHLYNRSATALTKA